MSTALTYREIAIEAPWRGSGPRSTAERFEQQEEVVGLFGRRRQAESRGSMDRTADKGDRAHLEEFVKSREGVEAFLEPRTNMTESSMVLVARSGEWTRRRVPDHATGFAWAKRLGIPCYDAGLIGYPSRMREWDAKKAAERRRLLEP